MKRWLAFIVAMIMVLSLITVVWGDTVNYYGKAGETELTGGDYDETHSKSGSLEDVLAWAKERTDKYIGIGQTNVESTPLVVRATKDNQHYAFFTAVQKDCETVRAAWSTGGFTLVDGNDNIGEDGPTSYHVWMINSSKVVTTWDGSLGDVLASLDTSDFVDVEINENNNKPIGYQINAEHEGRRYWYETTKKEDYQKVLAQWKTKNYTITFDGTKDVAAWDSERIDSTKTVTVCVYDGADNEGALEGINFIGNVSSDTIADAMVQARSIAAEKMRVGLVYRVYICKDTEEDFTVSNGTVYLYTLGKAVYRGNLFVADSGELFVGAGKYSAANKDVINKYGDCCIDEETETTIAVGTQMHNETGALSQDSTVANGSKHGEYITTCGKCGGHRTYRLHFTTVEDVLVAPDHKQNKQGLASERCTIDGCDAWAYWYFGPVYVSAVDKNKGLLGMSTDFTPADVMGEALEQNIKENNKDPNQIAAYIMDANFSCSGDLTVPTGKTVYLRTDIYGKTYGDSDTHKAAVFNGKFKFDNNGEKGNLIVREGLYTKNPSAYVEKDKGYRVTPVKGVDFGLDEKEYKNLFLVYQAKLSSSNVSISGDSDAMVKSGRQTLNSYEVMTGKSLTATDNNNGSWEITPTVDATHAVDTAQTAKYNLNTSGNAITVRVPVTGNVAVEGLTVAVTHSKNNKTVETVYGTVVKEGSAYYAEFVTDKGFSTFAVSEHTHDFTSSLCGCGTEKVTVGETTVIFEDTAVVPEVSGAISDDIERVIAETLAEKGVSIDVPAAVLKEKFVEEKLQALVVEKSGAIRVEPVVTATVKRVETARNEELNTQAVTFDVSVRLDIYVDGKEPVTIDLAKSRTKMDVTFPVLFWENDTTVYVTHKNRTETAKVENDAVTVGNDKGYSEFIVSLKAPSTHDSTSPSHDPDKLQSPPTFDAGIAVYAGMALASAAGAVYVGKKHS